MILFNFKKKLKREEEFASQVVEILEEKLEEMYVNVPTEILDVNETSVKLRADLRQELVYEIVDFISANKKVLVKKVA